MIRILVVDDDEKLAKSVSIYLGNSGYEANYVLNAAEDPNMSAGYDYEFATHTSLRFRRDRKICNKTELTRLQRNFDGCVSQIEALDRTIFCLSQTAEKSGRKDCPTA